MPCDAILLGYAQKMINQGQTQIELPGDLVAEASKEAFDEVRRLCKLCGVKIVVRA